jgi:glucan endo-1,3-alpha-glucosidase
MQCQSDVSYQTYFQKSSLIVSSSVAHYMIGGINDGHVLKDIQDAKSLGLDAFAMNFDQFAYWSNTTVERLFKHADAENFKLFFSFDHAKSPGLPSPPKKYASFLKTYMARPSYFRLNNKPLVTTFGGESIPDGDWSDLKKDAGPMNLVLGSYTSSPTSFFSGRNSVDGVFNWNSWPDSDTKRKDDVSCTADKAFQTAANVSRHRIQCV